MKYAAQIKPVSFLNNSAETLLKGLDEQGGTIILAEDGAAKIVLMDMPTYVAHMETIAFSRLVQMGGKDIADGKFQDLASFLTEMEQDEKTVSR